MRRQRQDGSDRLPSLRTGDRARISTGSSVEEAQDLLFGRDVADAHKQALAKVAGRHNRVQTADCGVGTADRRDPDLGRLQVRTVCSLHDSSGGDEKTCS